ncbi:MAG: selenocysteine-specific translation elongation factor [Firmicutes bacterium]|nr:selenocysteine-specific translation elongation factor [Bacillota bacterium]
MATDYVVVGTAGHVDHGKTALVKALTGVDTDRLKEEKERGISIELGFALLRLPGGRRAAIVDVPGHERFVRTMLAGASGVDLVMLVIAADEGVRPQTREHLDIVQLLQVRRGLVVLTKIDLVDRDWLALVEEEVREFLRGTVLEGAPLVRVSSVTGEGLAELVSVLDRLAASVEPRPLGEYVRLPVDRVFTVTGFGTVVTGTLWSGQLALNDAVEVLPARLPTRVRSLQVHGERVPAARAGQRVAVNLAGVEVAQVSRGDVVATPGVLEPTRRLDVRLRLVPGAPRRLANRARVRVYLGTAEVLGRVVLLDAEELPPGGEALAQLELERPAVAARGDRFVVRSYSPMQTIGGGVVIDPHARRHRRWRPQLLASLEVMERGSARDQVAEYLRRHPGFLSPEEVARGTGLPRAAAEGALRHLAAAGAVREVRAEGGEHFAAREVYDSWRRTAEAALADFHREYPLREGLGKEELRSRRFGFLSPRQFAFLLQALEEDGAVRAGRHTVALAGFRPTPDPAQREMLGRIEGALRAGGYQPPTWKEIGAGLAAPEREKGELLQYLLQQGTVVKVGEDLYFHREVVDEVRRKVTDFLREHGEITVGQMRDLLQSSRKYALPLLEYLDRERVTRRVGDRRVLVRE